MTSLHGLAIAVAPDGRIEVAASGDQGLLVLERAGSWQATTLASSISLPDLELLAGATSLDLMVRQEGIGFDTEAFVLHREGPVWSSPKPLPTLCCGLPHLIAANTAGMRPAALLGGEADGVLLSRGADGWSTLPLGWNTYLLSFGYDPAGKLYGMLFLAGDVDTATVLEFHER